MTDRLRAIERRLATFEETQSLQRARRQQYRAAIGTLHQWAADARNTTVTSGNAVQVLQTVVTRLGTFFDDFADLLEDQLNRR